MSQNLPWCATPEEQVAAAPAHDFFRVVQLNEGGGIEHLLWHDTDNLPCVSIFPVAKLMVGPDFAFGARWALTNSALHTSTHHAVARRGTRGRAQKQADGGVRALFYTSGRRRPKGLSARGSMSFYGCIFL